MAHSSRMTLTLPTETVEAIGAISKRLHITRSALVAELLSEPVAALGQFVDLIPPGPVTEGDVRRFRGDSIAYIQQRIAEITDAARSIDPTQKLL